MATLFRHGTGFYVHWRNKGYFLLFFVLSQCYWIWSLIHYSGWSQTRSFGIVKCYVKYLWKPLWMHIKSMKEMHKTDVKLWPAVSWPVELTNHSVSLTHDVTVLSSSFSFSFHAIITKSVTHSRSGLLLSLFIIPSMNPHEWKELEFESFSINFWGH